MEENAVSNLSLITTILDVLILFVAAWAVDRMMKARGKKGLIDLIRNRSADDNVTEVGIKDLDYQALFIKFIALTGMTSLDAFLMARTEKGFGHSDEKVRHHLKWYTKTGELPNYVESFLEDGRNFIVNA